MDYIYTIQFNYNTFSTFYRLSEPMWALNNNPAIKQPIYKQIVNHIEQAIENGQLRAGERLPSERQLSTLLKVNRSTIIHALDELTDRGVLIRKLGSGTYVNEQKWGLQSYPLINWQATPEILSKKRQDSYYLQANQLRQKAHSHQQSILDLANGDLPTDLLPTLSLPEFSWQELLTHEQGTEASHLGLISFRQAVKDYLQQRFKMTIATEQILITSGAQQAIFLITQGLLKPGDAIGIEAPSYFYSLPLFQAAGLRIYAIPTDQQGITLDGLEKLLNQQSIKMIFLNPIFQNPTGFVMSDHRKKQLLNYCYKKRIPIVEDDAYSALPFNSQLDNSPLKKLDKHQQVIYIGSLSKYIGKNIRAGWMVAPKAIVNKLADIRQQLDAGLSVLPQLLAEHYLTEHSSKHQQYLQTVLAKRSQQLMQWLTENYQHKLTFQPPLGGFHLYTHCLQKNTHDFNNLLDKLLKQNIIVARGTDFGDTPYHLRFSYGHFNIASLTKR